MRSSALGFEHCPFHLPSTVALAKLLKYSEFSFLYWQDEDNNAYLKRLKAVMKINMVYKMLNSKHSSNMANNMIDK